MFNDTKIKEVFDDIAVDPQGNVLIFRCAAVSQISRSNFDGLRPVLRAQPSSKVFKLGHRHPDNLL